MAAILIMVVTLAIIIGLVLVLLVEFFCSLLLRRHQRSKTVINFASVSTTQPPPECHEQEQSIAPTTLSSFYAQGVLHAPRNYLFPIISTKDHNFDDLEIVHENIPYPKLVHEVPPLQCSTSTMEEQFVYISNPIYDNEKMGLDTPFETPNSSPSCLEIICNSSEEDENYGRSSISSPSSVPLTPMKELPAEACSISLRDARLLGTSGSDSINSNNSSSSSGSPCTSPSW
ncbi:uncharacterized protein LOC132637974 [Lycium barbarum]|uniref:uncharacterized protein LOC132637974 n=1 Tax=Lycium barbarum TaxID=112863 RepID=UPI00293EAFF4|nr:uncharacterized protein LOC132637974 [Lycium barbarum]